MSQENNSYADATARNDNDTDQKIDQTQRSHGCGCKAERPDPGRRSWADAFAKNENELDPDIDQSQG